MATNQHDSPAHSTVRIQALGGYRIVVDGRDLRLRTRKEATLLLRLALAGDEGVSRDECIGLLWPDTSEARARHSLSEALRGIELATRIDVVRSPERLSLPAAAFAFDLRDLEVAVARGDVHACEEIYKGGFLAGWYPPTAEASHWVDGVAAAVAKRLEKATRKELAARRQATDGRGVIAAAVVLDRLGVATDEDREAAAEADQIIGWEALQPGRSLRIPVDRDGPFVGRFAEMKLLTRELELAVEGEVRVVLVSGDPGIGKTRICQRLARLAALRGSRLLMASCYELEQSIPYQAVGEAIRGSLHDNIACLTFPERQVLRNLLGDPPRQRLQADDPDDLAAGLNKRTVHEATVALIEEEGASRPIFFHTDDLQWADASSCQAIHYVLRTAKPKAGALFLFAYRRDEIKKNSAASALVRGLESRTATLVLGSIDASELRKHLDALFPTAASVVNDVLSLAGGNPFFARELTMAAVSKTEEGLAGPLADVILSRADQLPPLDRTLAEVISVWGSPVSPTKLARIADVKITDIARALERLRSQHLTKEVGADVTMAHELTRQAFYMSLSEPSRRSLHAMIATEMEEEGPAPFLAHHFAVGAQQERAAGYARVAAAASRKKKAYLEELRWLLLALENTTGEVTGALTAVVDRMFALAKYGEISELLTSYRRFVTSDLRMKGELARLKSAIARADNYEALIRDCDRLFTNTCKAGANVLAIEALRVKMRFAQELVDTPTTLQVAEDLAAFGRRAGDPMIRLQAEATSLIKLTSFKPNVVDARLKILRVELEADGVEASEIERSLGIPDAVNDYNHGRYIEAGSKVHQLLNHARQEGNWADEIRLRTILVPISTETGRFGRALRHAKFVSDGSRFLDASWERLMTLTNAATCYFEMQEYGMAKELARQAVAAEEHYPMWLIRDHPLALQGLCALLTNDVRTAMRYRDELRETLPVPTAWVGDPTYVVMLLARLEVIVNKNGDAARSILTEAISSERGFAQIYYWYVDLEWVSLGLAKGDEAREIASRVYNEADSSACRLVAWKAERLLHPDLSSQIRRAPQAGSIFEDLSRMPSPIQM